MQHVAPWSNATRMSDTVVGWPSYSWWEIYCVSLSERSSWVEEPSEFEELTVNLFCERFDINKINTTGCFLFYRGIIHSVQIVSLQSPLKGQLWSHYCLPSISLNLVTWYLNTKFRIISMPMIASFMCSLDLPTPLLHWTVYIHVGPLSSLGCLWANWKWSKTKQNSS